MSEKIFELNEIVKSIKQDYSGKSSFEENLTELIISVVSPKLQEILDDLCTKIVKNVHEIEGAESMVIHYTSIAALVSILEDAAKKKVKKKDDDDNDENDESYLRLYDSIHSNDPDEGNYLIRNLPKKYDWLVTKNMRHAYIASFIFSKNDEKVNDNLVFWNTYGQKGEGCSMLLHAPSSGLYKVLYGEDKKDTIERLQVILDMLQPLVDIDNLTIRNKIQEELAKTIWKSLEKIRYLYKSDAYKYENEYRFVILESDIDKDKIHMEYQDRNNFPARIRHYCEHDSLQTGKLFESGSIITLGPCVPYRENVRDCIETLIKRAGLYGPQIKFSEIFYRKS